MPAYYYVRDNGTFVGTATGDGGRVATTPRTGSWNATASESYVSISAALGATTAPAAGDYIMVAADHDHDYGATTSLTSTVTSRNGETLNVVSVSTSNQDQYSAGGKETNSSGGNTVDMQLAGPFSWFGVTIEANDGVTISGTLADAYFDSCTLSSIAATTRTISFSGQGQNTYCVNCTFDPVDSNTTLRFSGTQGSHSEYHFCHFPGSYTLGILTANSGDSRGSSHRFFGCDLSNFGTAGTDYILEGVGGDTGENRIAVDFSWCKINATVGGWVDGDLNARNSWVKATNCGSTSAEAEYQFFYKDAFGETEHSTSTYRDQSIAWPISGSKTSLVIDTATAARASFGTPHILDLPSRWAELSSATTDAVTFYLSSNTALDDNEVWIECIYPDGTNKHTPNRVTTRNTDILAAGTALTTDSSSTWTSGGSNKYKIKVDTSGDAGADCVPILRIYVAVQATIYLDWLVDIGT